MAGEVAPLIGPLGPLEVGPSASPGQTSRHADAARQAPELELNSKRVMNPPSAKETGVRSPPRERRTQNQLGIHHMIRNHDLYFYPQLDYRSPKTTSNSLGSFGIRLEQTSYLTPDADPVAPALDKALSYVTKTIESAVAAVEAGPVGQEVEQLQVQLVDAVTLENDTAARVSDLQRRRAESLRAGAPSNPETIRKARAAHVASGELVGEIRTLLEDAEARLVEETQAAKMEAIQALSSKTQAELQASERDAARVIVEALSPVYVLQSSLRDLTNRSHSARNPKAPSLPPMVFPASTAGYKTIKGSSPYGGDGPRRADDVLDQLPGPPVEVVNSL